MRQISFNKARRTLPSWLCPHSVDAESCRLLGCEAEAEADGGSREPAEGTPPRRPRRVLRLLPPRGSAPLRSELGRSALAAIPELHESVLR